MNISLIEEYGQDEFEELTEVRWSNGRCVGELTYAEAEALILAEYPDAEIGHSGDLTDGGDRTLAWADEAASENDAGQKAVASIRANGEEQ